MFPKWSEFTPERAESDLPRLLECAEKEVAAIETEGAADFEGLVHRLDDATRELWRTWGMVSHSLGVMNSEAWRKVEEKWQGKIVAFSLRTSQSRRIYEMAKALAEKEKSPVRRRILEKMVEGAEHAGVGLEGAKRERFNEIASRLAQLASDFSNAVIDATAAFKYEKDGKTWTIDDAAYMEAMKHCRDREIRERLFRARATRAPENESRIAEILKLRSESAALLGYADYAELSLASKCAPSVAAVMKMIDDLDEATAAKAAVERKELGEELEPWDIAFAAERLREARYAYSEEEVKKCFRFPEVLQGLFRLSKQLLGIEVHEIVGTDKPEVWHEDVRFFEVKEQGETIAHFYLDPYVRRGLKQGGAWMNEFRNRDKRRGTTPLAVVVLNLKDDAMPLREVETLFHEFGHALQCMLTKVDEEDAAGINLVEWDAVEVASQFMENWCLDEMTGIEVPAELKKKIKAAKNFRAASVCRRQLAFAKTDMELHSVSRSGGGILSAADGIEQIKQRNFEHFGLETVDGDLFLCAFTHIFAGGYAAGYYGYKWAEVMSADCYGAFEEADAYPEIGRRYRETILALGGSKSALEVFREFRGRDPEIAALLRQQELS